MEKRLGKSVLVLPQQYMTNETEKSKELIDNFHDEDYIHSRPGLNSTTSTTTKLK